MQIKSDVFVPFLEIDLNKYLIFYRIWMEKIESAYSYSMVVIRSIVLCRLRGSGKIKYTPTKEA